MKLKKESIEKENLEKPSNGDPSIWQKIWLILRNNWLSLTCALIICVITIVAVPIIYSIDKGEEAGGITVLSWNVSGQTLINGTTPFDAVLLPFLNQTKLVGWISALVFDSKDNLYLVDSSQHRIVRYSVNEPSLKLFFGRANGTNGSDFNSLNTPRDLAFTDTEMLIADSLNHRILGVTLANPTARRVFGTDTAGSAAGQLNTPTSVAVNENRLYIADYGNHRIVEVDLQASTSSAFLVNSTGLARNRFVYTPISVRYHIPTSTLVIGQELGFNVIRWKPGAPEWTLIAGSASSQLSGTSRTLFSRVCAINVNSPFNEEVNKAVNQDNTYIADCDNQRIQFFRGDGTKGRTIAGVIQASGNTEYLFNQPSAVAFDKDMNLYVADSNNSRIQKFQRV